MLSLSKLQKTVRYIEQSLIYEENSFPSVGIIDICMYMYIYGRNLMYVYVYLWQESNVSICISMVGI